MPRVDSYGPSKLEVYHLEITNSRDFQALDQKFVLALEPKNSKFKNSKSMKIKIG